MLVERKQIDYLSMSAPKGRTVYRGRYLGQGGKEFSLTRVEMEKILAVYDCAAQKVCFGFLKLNTFYSILFNGTKMVGKLTRVDFQDPYNDMEVAVLKYINANGKQIEVPIQMCDNVRVSGNVIMIQAQ